MTEENFSETPLSRRHRMAQLHQARLRERSANTPASPVAFYQREIENHAAEIARHKTAILALQELIRAEQNPRSKASGYRLGSGGRVS